VQGAARTHVLVLPYVCAVGLKTCAAVRRDVAARMRAGRPVLGRHRAADELAAAGGDAPASARADGGAGAPGVEAPQSWLETG